MKTVDTFAPSSRETSATLAAEQSLADGSSRPLVGVLPRRPTAPRPEAGSGVFFGALVIVVLLLTVLGRPWQQPVDPGSEQMAASTSNLDNDRNQAMPITTMTDTVGAIETPGALNGAAPRSSRERGAADSPSSGTLQLGSESPPSGAILPPVLGSNEPATGADVSKAAVRTGAVANLCTLIGNKLSSVSAAECASSHLRDTGASSVLGRPLLAVDVGPEPDTRAIGRILLLGGIHGDEYSAVTIVFKWLSLLESQGGGEIHWRVLPLVNPDGLLRARSQRMNDNGVDLNRNFPTPNWEDDAHDYWVRKTGRNPRRYPGSKPLSEPESRFLHQEISSFEPDLVVAVHAPLEVVDFDGPMSPPERLGSLYLKKMGTFPGSLGRYGGEQIRLPIVTIELPNAGTMPSTEEQERIWKDLVAYAHRALREPKPTPPRAAVATQSPNRL